MATTHLRRDVDREVVQAWLDALSTGACDEAEFLRAVEKLTRRSSEAGWDSLALLDQYYRLGKIPSEVFNSIKSRLGSQLVGAGTEGELSVPLPQTDDGEAAPAPPSPPAAAPRPVPRPAAAPPAIDAGTQVPKPVADPPLSAVTAAAAAAATPTPIASRSVEPLRRTRREIAVGEVLRGRYVIKSVLGRGGTGMVFEAADLYRVDMPDAGQRVALKVLHGQISGRPELLAELQREFQLLQSLSHPNIVRAHDFDRDGDIAFFTMEQLRGLSLTGVLAARNQAPLERPLALCIVRDVGAAVAHAHSRAVVHGDLNPGNIFITNEGEVRVLDFGAAHVSEGPTLSSAPSDPAPVATPRYASAQVLEGKRPDARDDVYSLACLAYLLLTGKHPFAEKTALEAHEQRLKPSRPAAITGKAWRALRLGLAFDRERRPSDVTGWLGAFDWSDAAPRLPLLLSLVRVSSSKRSGLAMPAIAAVVVAALAAAWWASAHFDLRGALQSSSPSESEPAAGVPQPTQPDQTSPATHPASEAPSARAQVADQSPASAPPTSSSPPPAAAVPPQPPPSRANGTVPASEAQSTPSSAARHTAAAAATARLAAEAAEASAAQANDARSGTAESGPAQSGAQSRSRIELAADTIDVPLTDPAARVVVRRRGSLHGDATFTWWTESGTAKPGHDFMAVAPHQEVIEDGKNAVSLFIPVVNDATRQEPKSFYVVINDPGDGVSLGARTLTMVTIPPSE